MTVRIAAVSKQPELAPLAAERRVNAFFNGRGGYTVEEMTALILKPPVDRSRPLSCSTASALLERRADA